MYLPCASMSRIARQCGSFQPNLVLPNEGSSSILSSTQWPLDSKRFDLMPWKPRAILDKRMRPSVSTLKGTGGHDSPGTTLCKQAQIQATNIDSEQTPEMNIICERPQLPVFFRNDNLRRFVGIIE